MRCWKAVIPVTAADNTERLHELYEGFNDIREELEDAVISFELLQEDIRLALEDISEELEIVQDHLQKCGRMFRRFSSHGHKDDESRPPA